METDSTRSRVCEERRVYYPKSPQSLDILRKRQIKDSPELLRKIEWIEQGRTDKIPVCVDVLNVLHMEITHGSVTMYAHHPVLQARIFFPLERKTEEEMSFLGLTNSLVINPERQYVLTSVGWICLDMENNYNAFSSEGYFSLQESFKRRLPR